MSCRLRTTAGARPVQGRWRLAFCRASLSWLAASATGRVFAELAEIGLLVASAGRGDRACAYRKGNSVLKVRFVYLAASVCAFAMIIGVSAWIWQVAGRQDEAPSRRGVVSQLMKIKTQSMVDLRDGLATADYRQLEDGVARLRKVNDAASWYLSEGGYGEAGSAFRRALEQFGDDVRSRELSMAKRSFEELTTSCVACHRSAPIIQLDDDLKPLPK